MRRSLFLTLAVVLTVIPGSGGVASGRAWNDWLDHADSLSDAWADDSAIAIGELALQMALEANGPTDSSVGIILGQLGRYAYFAGYYPEAEDYFLRSAEALTAAFGRTNSRMAAVLNNIGVTRYYQAEYFAAESVHLEALAIRREVLGPDHLEVAASLNNLGNVMSELGQWGRAEEYYRGSLDIREKALGPEDPGLCSSLDNLALFYHEMGDYVTAESLYLRSAHIQKEANGPESFDLALTYNNLGLLYHDQGILDKARDLYERAVWIHETAHDPFHPEVAYPLSNLGDIFTETGEYEKADSVLRRSLAIRRKALGEDHPKVATVLINMGMLRERQGMPDSGRVLYSRALAIRQEVYGSDHPELATVMTNLAQSFIDAGRYDTAGVLLARGLEIRKAGLGESHPLVATSLEALADYQWAVGDVKTAFQTAARAFGLRHEKLQEGLTALSEKDAMAHSRQMRSVADKCLSILLDMDSPDSTVLAQGTEIVLRAKGEVSDAVLERHRLLNRLDSEDDVVGALADSLRTTSFILSRKFAEGPSEEDPEVYRRSLDSLAHERDRLEGKLTRRSHSFSEYRRETDITAKSIQSHLPPGAALIEFVRFHRSKPGADAPEPYYLAALLDADRTHLVPLGPGKGIDSLAQEYWRLTADLAWQRPFVADSSLDTWQNLSNELYRRVWSPLADHIDDSSLVLVAPDGSLNTVSFATLNSNGTYLIESYPIHYLTAARDLLRRHGEPTAASGLLAIGDPDFDAGPLARLENLQAAVPKEDRPIYASSIMRGTTRPQCQYLREARVEALPYSGREVRGVADLVKAAVDEPVMVATGAGASEECFKRRASGWRLIHLATHGFYRPPECAGGATETAGGQAFENPLLQSGLFLAGCNVHGGDTTAPKAEDGILTAEEVARMDLSGCQCVVLSACETGLGRTTTGEGIYGLRRAFVMAGAGTVVSALWPIGDKVTVDIMRYVYDPQQASLAGALRQMALDRLRTSREAGDRDDPIVWGAFVAVGDWQTP